MRYLKWLILAGALVVLAVTNPTMSAYTVWAVHTIEAHATGLVSALSTLFSGSIENAVAASTARDNYVLFSIYRTTALGHQFTVLGIFHHFIVLSQR